MILQDIKEQIVFSNIQPTEEKSEFPQNIRQEHPSIQARDSGSLQQSSQLYYPQMVSGGSNKESSLGGIDEKLIQQLTLETLSEKLLSSLKSELPQEKPKSSSLFQPVESKPLPEVKQQGNNEQINQMASMFGMNSTQLPTMIAENILGLFNAAMMQINTSLSKNMTHPSQIENLSQKHKENIAKTIETYTKKEEQKMPVPQSLPKKETVIQEENIRSSSEYLKPNIFAKPRKEVIQETPQRFDVHQERDLREQVLIREEKPHRAWTEDRRQGSILTALQQEGRNIQEEQEIIRQRKHYVSPGQTLQGNYGVPMQQGYYFLNHNPQPIANLSEYYKELQSDSSSSDLNNTRGVPSQRDISHRDEKRSMGGRRTPSAYDNDLLSEGQVMFPYMEATERTIDSATIDLPNYASTRTMGFGLETDMSIDPRCKNYFYSIINMLL